MPFAAGADGEGARSQVVIGPRASSEAALSAVGATPNIHTHGPVRTQFYFSFITVNVWVRLALSIDSQSIEVPD